VLNLVFGVLYCTVLCCFVQVFNMHWAVRYCVVPAYVVSWLLLLSGLSATQDWIWVAAFVVSCCVTLVPAWLIEFRYV
jgi:alpha-1,2-glucosyltransferase